MSAGIWTVLLFTLLISSVIDARKHPSSNRHTNSAPKQPHHRNGHLKHSKAIRSKRFSFLNDSSASNASQEQRGLISVPNWTPTASEINPQQADKSLEALSQLFGPIPANYRVRRARSNGKYETIREEKPKKKFLDGSNLPNVFENSAEEPVDPHFRAKRDNPDDSPSVSSDYLKNLADSFSSNIQNEVQPMSEGQFGLINKKHLKSTDKKSKRATAKLNKENLHGKKSSTRSRRRLAKKNSNRTRIKRFDGGKNLQKRQQSSPSLFDIKDLAENIILKVDQLEEAIKSGIRRSRYSQDISFGQNYNNGTGVVIGTNGISASDRIDASKGLDSRKKGRRECEDENLRKKKIRRKWARWTDWSSCSVTCGKGRQIRWRHCNRDCNTAEMEMEEKSCQLPACAPNKLFGIF